MAIEYFCCYHSYLKKCEKLTDQELGRLFRALMIYSDTGEQPELAGRESIAFDFIADDIDRAKRAYEDRCRENSRKGKMGGRPKKPQLSEKAEKATAFSESQKSQNKDKNKDKNKDNNTPLPPTVPETGFGVDLQCALDDWLAYKREKRQGYKPTGLKSLVAQIQRHTQTHGEAAVAALIRECMACNWQGIIWDRLKNSEGTGRGYVYDYGDTEGSL